MNNTFSHPDWSYSTSIYEVNVRQYTAEGTFIAFQKHLPRLKDMGVEVLWFMPVTPISFKDRKGTLGSYYAVKNYTAVNPEFGSMNDFKNLTAAAHDLGFKIIIDWVANHSGNDNVWIEQHPDFFCYDNAGQIIHPNGWEDVTKLNYDSEAMQNEMIKAMQFWITETNIDGFRCDMAHLVPLEFWKKARTYLDKVKSNLFWLAECEEPTYHEVFDATYTWQWMHKTEEFCKHQINLQSLVNLLKSYDLSFAKDALRVYFTSNHDENSWNGSEYEKYNDAAELLAVFSCTWNGIPLIYSGQELPNKKRLKFFDKDEIDWNDKLALHEFYKTLLHLRKKNKALRAGDNVVTTILETELNDKIFSFTRSKEQEQVLVILNFSPENITCDLNNLQGTFKNIFSIEEKNFQQNPEIKINAWGYQVFEKTA